VGRERDGGTMTGRQVARALLVAWCGRGGSAKGSKGRRETLPQMFSVNSSWRGGVDAV
jgi:hypothetical protein